MDIALTIVHLLEKHHKVQLNNFGTFTTVYCASKIDTVRGELVPPYYEVHFAANNVTGDELLLLHLQEKLGFKAVEVQEIIDNWQQKLWHKLESENAAHLKGLGTLLFKNGELSFIADKINNEASGSYGLERLDLSAFETLAPIQKVSTKPNVEEEPTNNQQHKAVIAQIQTVKTNKAKQRVFPVLLIWTILIVFLVYLFLILKSSYLPIQLKTFAGGKPLVISQKEFVEPDSAIEEVKETIVDSNPMSVDSIITDSLTVLETEMDGTIITDDLKPIEFKIIVQEFKAYSSAVSLKRDISSLGIPATILSNADSTLFAVTAYNSFQDSLEALPKLRIIKSKVRQGAVIKANW